MLRALFPPALVRLLVAFVGLALLYAYAVPVFESPDETTHVGMVQTIATTGQLPVQQVGEETIYAQEGSQPPLYYLIAAQIMRLFDRSDFAQALAKNPHAIVGIPGAVGNKNITLHDQLYPPALHGTVLAVYALRLFSIVLGAVSVTAIFHSGRLLAPQHPGVALLAAGLTAFNPQFLFISASVNNDNLVTALNCLVLWQVLVMLRDGFSTRRSVLMAVLLALAGISKLSGLVLLPVVALAALWVGFRRRDWQRSVPAGHADRRGLAAAGRLVVRAQSVALRRPDRHAANAGHLRQASCAAAAGAYPSMNLRACASASGGCSAGSTSSPVTPTTRSWTC